MSLVKSNDLHHDRWLHYTLVVLCGLGLILSPLGNVQARKPGVAGEKQVASGKFEEAIRLLEAESLKGADEWYLLGKAYQGLGRKQDAYQAWTEALVISKKASKRKKWDFLYPPSKSLKAKEKKKLVENFEDDYRELNGAIARAQELKARELKNEASRTKIEATRKDAKEEQLTKIADAKSKTINDKQKIADRRARNASKRPPPTPIPRPRGRGSLWGIVIIGGLIGLVLLLVITSRRRSGGGTVIVYEDDARYDRGAFYYEGHYFTSQDMFYDRYGYYYTNRMYREYGHNHGRRGYDDRMDHDIMQDVHEREELYTEAAQEGYEADMMRADAAHLEQDAYEIEQEIGDGEEALSAFDHVEDHEFEDDEDYGDDEQYASADDEFEDDPNA